MRGDPAEQGARPFVDKVAPRQLLGGTQGTKAERRQRHRMARPRQRAEQLSGDVRREGRPGGHAARQRAGRERLLRPLERGPDGLRRAQAGRYRGSYCI